MKKSVIFLVGLFQCIAISSMSREAAQREVDAQQRAREADQRHREADERRAEADRRRLERQQPGERGPREIPADEIAIQIGFSRMLVSSPHMTVHGSMRLQIPRGMPVEWLKNGRLMTQAEIDAFLQGPGRYVQIVEV